MICESPSAPPAPKDPVVVSALSAVLGASDYDIMRAGMWRRASTSALLGVRKSAPHAYTFARALSTKVKTEPHPFESFISGSSGG